MLLPDTLNGRVLVGGDGGLWGCKRSSPTAIPPPSAVSLDHTFVSRFQASNAQLSTTLPLPTLLQSGRTTVTMEASGPSSVRISHHQCFLSNSICGGAPRQPDSTGLLQRFAPSFELRRVFCGRETRNIRCLLVSLVV